MQQDEYPRAAPRCDTVWRWAEAYVELVDLACEVTQVRALCFLHEHADAIELANGVLYLSSSMMQFRDGYDLACR